MAPFIGNESLIQAHSNQLTVNIMLLKESTELSSEIKRIESEKSIGLILGLSAILSPSHL